MNLPTFISEDPHKKPAFLVEASSPLWKAIKDNQPAQEQLSGLIKSYATQILDEAEEVEGFCPKCGADIKVSEFVDGGSSSLRSQLGLSDEAGLEGEGE